MPNPDPRVYLVGGGPGDPGLITLRGVECLGRADVVLYDYLVNPRILQHAAEGAECICLGQHGRSRIWSQDEVNRYLVEQARAGRTVVRLKGGDPAVFARVGEEVDALVAAQIPFEIVPGITAALAASSYAGIPLTHRDAASAVALVTAHEADKPHAAVDFSALAQFPGTLVFYMGVTTAETWSAALINAGKSPDTPVAIVRRCSFPDQHRIACRLGELSRVVAAERLRPPAIFIVGWVADLPDSWSWFERRPLFGQSVLVTRARAQASGLARPLSELGAEVLEQPVIELGEPPSWAAVDRALDQLHVTDWVVFSSVNGVERFLQRLWDRGGDWRALGRVRLAAIGAATASALESRGLRTDLVPDQYRAEALAEALAEVASGSRVLLVRASRGRELLAEQLRQAGAQVEQVVVYTSTDVGQADPEISRRLAEGRIDWVTITSSAIARAAVRLWGEHLHRCRIASISPLTTGVLRELGFEAAAEAQTYTMQGVIQAMLAAGTSA